MKYFSLYKLEIISFITGFCLLAYELAAARILAPTIGSSTYVWTSVIGTIIAALSVGYFVGGKVADMRNRESDVAWALLLAALATLFSLMTYVETLQWLAMTQLDARLQAVIAASLLFAPASFVMGAVSPYLAKLNVRSLATSGSAVASLSGLNSIGGIVGTFVTGFFLFGYVGSRETVIIIGLLLVATSWIMLPRFDVRRRLAVSGAVTALLLLPAVPVQAVASIDTPSARYEVYDFLYNGIPARGLSTGPSGIQSAVYVNGSPELLFWYTRQMAAQTLERSPKRVLMLGGGAFTLPEYLSRTLPDTKIDVVEIDPELKHISEQYFYYTNPSNVNLIFTDARTYVNQTDKRYDVVLVDVYGDGTIPFTLITQEYARKLEQLVSPGGVVLANIIGGEQGACAKTLDAVMAAYTTHFPYALITKEPGRPGTRANYMALLSRQPQQEAGYRPYTKQTRAYTDNLSPSDRIYYGCLNSVQTLKS